MKRYDIPSHAGTIVLDGVDLNELELQISDIERDFKVREIDITFKEEKLYDNQVRHSSDAYKFIKEVIFDGMEIQEHFVVLYMNQANRITGYYKHSKGTINSTQVDIEIITAVAIKTLSKAMIISHNHPSGNTRPSEADRRMTKRLKEAASMFDISVLDHIICTADNYYSFADNSEGSLSGPSEESVVTAMRERILQGLRQVTEANSPNIHRMIQTKEGYRKLEERILEKVLRDNRIPEAVIPQIEMEWN
ncbi:MULTISPECIES: JAB domain-containing protein [Croceimicrobium]|uniref:JAB domain-containing protein n=1 Tax=Croceimicrobium hydrocarbonivorans TaxID=2761580 RepID=A0A7H0VBT5_9FLAO|nr:JAB domain-containing protein [Croceimicrobium hydrocarbonivorans]QNR23183.1 JAB domain-containing protein [Croceimicrobium hydrocarbonivorans]